MTNITDGMNLLIKDFEMLSDSTLDPVQSQSLLESLIEDYGEILTDDELDKAYKILHNAYIKEQEEA